MADMRIQNLTSLVGGELINSPKISMVGGFSFDTNLKNSSTYIALNSTNEEISLAIQNGAYAVIYDRDLAIKNDEIALIKVSNIPSAVLRLIRFFITQKSIKLVKASKVQISILKCLNLKNARLIADDLREIFYQIYDALDGDLFFCDVNFLQKLGISFDEIKTTQKIDIFNNSSIFYTTMISSQNYYQNLSFPYLYASELGEILAYLNSANIEFKFKDLREFEHFKPIFVDRFFNIKPFGASHRAFIVESDEELFIKEAGFLRAKFDDILVCVPKNLAHIKADIYFSNLDELKSLNDFKYALVLCEFCEFELVLSRTSQELSLFD
ncbi:hypothetical protein [Campylobacter iguaniorum]|nr:hypothetical protein [Campylobacter iguaniorum]